MLDSLYIGLTGLTSYSYGLTNISNNVGNMNSTGYKGTGLQFGDLYYKTQLSVNGDISNPYYSQGTGVGIRQQFTNFTAGELRQTGQDTDLAISGFGFFILRQNGQQSYTRNGSFKYDDQNYLVDPTTGAHVAGLTAANTLEDINLGAYSVSPAKATQTVKLTGNLSTNDSDGTHTISDVVVYDSAGNKNTFKITLTKGSIAVLRSWDVRIENEKGMPVAIGEEVRFQPNGSPEYGFSTVPFTMTTASGETMTVTLDFGDPGSFAGVTNFSAGTDSTVSVASQDGYTVGTLQKAAFKSDGVLSLEYTNGQKMNGPRLALAWFDDLQKLDRNDGARFTASTDIPVRIGAAQSSYFGQIAGGRLEASNVDLAREFSSLIIIQRGYQSSSQVIGAANEMAQQVIELVSRK